MYIINFFHFSWCPTLIWVTLLLFFTSICFALSDGIARLKQLHQIPCTKCAFFTGEYHLKCTVHPCKALSENAINCLDYEPVFDSKKPLFSKLTLNRLSRSNL